MLPGRVKGGGMEVYRILAGCRGGGAKCCSAGFYGGCSAGLLVRVLWQRCRRRYSRTESTATDRFQHIRLEPTLRIIGRMRMDAAVSNGTLQSHVLTLCRPDCPLLQRSVLHCPQITFRHKEKSGDCLTPPPALPAGPRASQNGGQNGAEVGHVTHACL